MVARASADSRAPSGTPVASICRWLITLGLALGTATSIASAQTDYRDLICSYPWSCTQALAVARCESTFNPNAVSPSGHIGLFQISPRFHSARLWPGESLTDPEANVRIAWELYSEAGGWGPWSCKP